MIFRNRLLWDVNAMDLGFLYRKWVALYNTNFQIILDVSIQHILDISLTKR